MRRRGQRPAPCILLSTKLQRKGEPMLDVLLVDDDDIVRASIAQALERAGHNVTEAVDGDEAARLVDTKKFDLAICDVQMPKMDGLTLFRRVKRVAPRTAVVIMTSFRKIPD